MRRYMASTNRPPYSLAARVLWLALDDSTVIGYTAGHLTKRYDCQGELQWIYVLAEHRRTQVAADLLRHLAKWYVENGAKRVCVAVVGEQSARSLYTRLGAVPLNDDWMVWENIESLLVDK